MERLIPYIIVFVCSTGLDILWCLYIYATSKQKIWLAVITSGLLALIGLVGLFQIIDNLTWLLGIPYVAGYCLGTYLGIKISERLE